MEGFTQSGVLINMAISTQTQRTRYSYYTLAETLF